MSVFTFYCSLAWNCIPISPQFARFVHCRCVFLAEPLALSSLLYSSLLLVVLSQPCLPFPLPLSPFNSLLLLSFPLLSPSLLLPTCSRPTQPCKKRQQYHQPTNKPSSFSLIDNPPSPPLPLHLIPHTPSPLQGLRFLTSAKKVACSHTPPPNVTHICHYTHPGN